MSTNPQAQIVLPDYPASPASLIAAQTFYNAAREEINERCKFRDQVIISVITAIIAFVAFIDPAKIGDDFSKVAESSNAISNVLLALLVTNVSLAISFFFMARYVGYQNLKIAELGYFITSSPAYHFQVYGEHELSVEPSGETAVLRNNAIRRLPKVTEKLRRSLTHWDQWAVADQTADPIEKLKSEFTQTSVYRYLLYRASYLGLALTAIVIVKLCQHSSFATLSVLDWVILFFAVCYGIVSPFRTDHLLDKGNEVKSYYAELRDNHENLSKLV